MNILNIKKYKIGFHINKKYNFVKGLTISEILIYTWIGVLAITSITGIIIIFGTIILDPKSVGDSMNTSGFHF